MQKTYIGDIEAKDTICDIGNKMYQRGYVSANDGNITIRVGDNEVWATPTGISKNDLIPEKLIKVTLKGEILDNPSGMKPTSEMPMHLKVYETNNDIISTCHSHSFYASLCSCVGLNLDFAYSPEPTGVLGVIPLALYCRPGSKELAESIAPFCNDYKGCLLANHGPMTWGKTPYEAMYRMEAIEAYAKQCIFMECLVGRARILTKTQIDDVIANCKPTDATEKNLMRGVSVELNRKSADNLSSISRVNGQNEIGNSSLSNQSIDKIADIIIKKLKETGI